MKASFSFTFLAALFAASGDISAVAVHVDGDADGSQPRGLSYGGCTYGDPLGGNSDYYYDLACMTPQACTGNPNHGYYVDNYCDGGEDNKCCITLSTCSVRDGLDSYLCANTGTRTCEGHYRSGYCPGPSYYQCCVT